MLSLCRNHPVDAGRARESYCEQVTRLLAGECEVTTIAGSDLSSVSNDESRTVERRHVPRPHRFVCLNA